MPIFVDGTTELTAANLNKTVAAANYNKTNTRLCATVVTCSVPSATSDLGFSATVTKNAVGDYTLNFANAYVGAPVVLAMAGATVVKGFVQVHTVSTTQIRLLIFDAAAAAIDPTTIHVFAFGV